MPSTGATPTVRPVDRFRDVLCKTGMRPDGVAALVARVPGWGGRAADLRPLPGGITNRNFVVAVDGREWVIRVPGERTELLGIDRSNEREAAERAARLGIGPPVFGELPDVRTLITELVPGRHLEGAAFEARIGDVVDRIQRFHRSGPLAGAFPVHRVVEWHARDAATRGTVAPGAYERLHQQSRRIEKAFAVAPRPLVPSHNDLLPANVLFDDDRVWLLDFEYAGMNDEFFDLGNLSVNAGLSEAAEHEVLARYFGQVTPVHWARLQLMKVMSEFREGMWAVVQTAISTLGTDFAGYADERLRSCEKLVARPEFTTWLEDAARPLT